MPGKNPEMQANGYTSCISCESATSSIDAVHGQADLWRLPRWRLMPAAAPDLPPLQWLRLLSRTSAGSSGTRQTMCTLADRSTTTAQQRACSGGCTVRLRALLGGRTEWVAASWAARARRAASSTERGSFMGMSQSMVPPADSADISLLSLSDWSSGSSGSGHRQIVQLNGGVVGRDTADGDFHAGLDQAACWCYLFFQATEPYLLAACLQSLAACQAGLWAAGQPAALEQWGLAAQAASDITGQSATQNICKL